MLCTKSTEVCGFIRFCPFVQTRAGLFLVITSISSYNWNNWCTLTNRMGSGAVTLEPMPNNKYWLVGTKHWTVHKAKELYYLVDGASSTTSGMSWRGVESRTDHQTSVPGLINVLVAIKSLQQCSNTYCNASPER